MNYRQQLGARIREARGETSQRRFAKELGCAINTFRRYESGEREPGAEALAKLAELTGRSGSWLLWGRAGDTAQRLPIPNAMALDARQLDLLHEASFRLARLGLDAAEKAAAGRASANLAEVRSAEAENLCEAALLIQKLRATARLTA